LAPLTDNGGPTQTHALLANSPARDAGIVSTCTTTDQRGETRDSQCDIGSYEFSEDENCFVIKTAVGTVAVFCL